jgi:tetratricopeptide (TPR) repeat protein
VYIQQNELDLALADLDAAVALSPDAELAHLMRANIYGFLGEFDAASDDYDALIDLHPDDSNFYIERGHLNFQTGQVNAALDDFSQAITLNPDADEAYAMRAMMLLQLEADTANALSDINRAIDLNPESGEYYLLRGSIRATNEEQQASAEDYFQWIMRNLTEFRSAENAVTSSQIFTVEMELGWVYGIPFRAVAGQRVNFAAQHDAEVDGVDPLLIVLSEAGLPLIADDDSGGNMDALILGYQIPTDGEYMLLVSHAAAGVQGDITITVDLGDNT